MLCPALPATTRFQLELYVEVTPTRLVRATSAARFIRPDGSLPLWQPVVHDTSNTFAWIHARSE